MSPIRVASTQAFLTPTHRPKSKHDNAYDDALADGRLGKYETELMVGYRKRVGKRHARRKMARASRKAHR